MDSLPAPGRNQTREDAFAFWYGLINFEQRSANPADLKLDRMRALLSRLGNPHQRLRIVHVAGTKGKGSTSAMLASILRKAGYRTGLFTSPHLVRVEERFQVDGEPISSDELTLLLHEVREAAAARPADSPTFFEAATAVGFLHFVRRRVDVAVIEVGLGGRLDSTNVCQPMIAIITSISLDHTKQLGDRLASIAMEKAGIIKPRRPALSGATVPEARGVIEEICRQRQAPLRQLGAEIHYDYEPGLVTPDSFRRPRMRLSTDKRAWPPLELNLLGEHQAANAALAVACVEQLRNEGWHLPDEAVTNGLAEVEWAARLEVVRRRPLVILDCAHNVASASAVIETLCHSFPAGRRILLFAGSSDKDLPGMLRILAPHFQHAILTRYTNSPRWVAPEQLAHWLRLAGEIPMTLSPTPAQAWRTALELAQAEDLVCITGSIFLAGELRPVVAPEGQANQRCGG